jgi:uncharacterized protein (DUF302 family)
MKTESHSTVVHVDFGLSRPFDEAAALLESTVRAADWATLRLLAERRATAEEIRAAIAQMVAPTGLMIFAAIDQGPLLSLLGTPKRARQYAIGNALIASELLECDIRAGLLAPLRVFLYGDARGVAHLSYDLPSSLFGRFGDARMDRVARELDAKLARVAEALAR